jgi:DNA-binding transcriptional LysR family regulator
MDLQSLNIFIQVAELKNFTKAGQKLGYSQPTVSFQIKQLEEELGTRLFDRIGHTVTLTEAGCRALEYAQTICRMSEEMVQGAGMHQNAGGVIKIGLPDSLCTPFIVNRFQDFRNEYPHISLEVTNAGTDTMFHLLDHNQVDIICTLDSPIYDTNYVLAHEEKVGTSFVMSVNNLLASKKKITIKDIMDQDVILTEKGMSYRRLLDERLAKEGMEINPVLEIGRTDLICEMVADNMGISFLPDFVTEDGVKSGKLVRFNVKGYGIDIWKQLVYRKEKWISMQMKAIIEHMAVNVM